MAMREDGRFEEQYAGTGYYQPVYVTEKEKEAQISRLGGGYVTPTAPKISQTPRRMGGPQGIRRTEWGDPLTNVRTQAVNVREKALELKLEGKHFEAGIHAGAYMGLSVVEGVGQTIAVGGRIVRDPVGVLSDIGYTATHLRSTIGLIGVSVARDPVRVVGNVAGGLLVGAVASDVIATARGPKTVKTVETKIVRKPRLGRGFSRTELKPSKAVIHTEDFLGAHQVQTGGAWPKSGRTGLGKPHYAQTGHDLIQIVPQSGGVEQTVYKLTTRVTRAPTRLRGAVAISRTVITHTPRTSSIVGPLVGGALGTFQPVKPSPPLQKPVQVQKQIQVQGSRAKVMTEQAIISRPVTRSKIVPQMITPGYTPAPPITGQILLRSHYMPQVTKTTQRTTPIMATGYATRPMQRQRTQTPTEKRARAPPIPYMSTIRRQSLTAPPPGRRRRRKKKMGGVPRSLHIWGEFRDYPVKTPEAVLRSIRI